MNPLGITGHYPIHSLTLVHKGPVFKPKTSGGSRASKPTCHNHLEPYFCPVCPCSNRVLLYTAPCCLPLPRRSLGIPTQMSASILYLSSTALHKELQYRTYHMVSIYSTPSRTIISPALKETASNICWVNIQHAINTIQSYYKITACVVKSSN